MRRSTSLLYRIAIVETGLLQGQLQVCKAIKPFFAFAELFPGNTNQKSTSILVCIVRQVTASQVPLREKLLGAVQLAHG